MENFFLEGFVWWRYERAQWEYEARSRNWIWLDKVTSYVIKQIEWWKIHLVLLVCNNLILSSKEHRFSLYGHTIWRMTPSQAYWRSTVAEVSETFF